MAHKKSKKTPAARSAIAIIMARRFGGKGGPMHHRCERRGGARNKQAEHMKEAAE